MSGSDPGNNSNNRLSFIMYLADNTIQLVVIALLRVLHVIWPSGGAQFSYYVNRRTTSKFNDNTKGKHHYLMMSLQAKN